MNIKLLRNIPTKCICTFRVICKIHNNNFLKWNSWSSRCDNLHFCWLSKTFRSSLSSVSAWTNPSTYEVETACSPKSIYSATSAWCYNREGEDINNPRCVKTGNFILIVCWSEEVVCFVFSLMSLLVFEHYTLYISRIGEFELLLKFATGSVNGRH